MSGSRYGARGSRRRDRDFQIFSLSFLDAICCAFGALILIMVLAQVGRPKVIEAINTTLKGTIERREAQLGALSAASEALVRDLPSAEAAALRQHEHRLALERELARLNAAAGGTPGHRDAAELAAAEESLTPEMRRLLGERFERARRAPIGGVPVDAEYVVFLIDNSGSMQSYSWQAAQAKLREVLDMYPALKGFQVMNDQGRYLFADSRGQWLGDSPERRRAVVAALTGFNAVSASDPTAGIVAAIRTFASPAHKVSVYVFGDEFTGASIQQSVDAIDAANPRDASGERRVRIHYIGFPLDPGAPQFTNTRLAELMRVVCERNGGSFVGLVR